MIGRMRSERAGRVSYRAVCVCDSCFYVPVGALFRSSGYNWVRGRVEVWHVVAMVKVRVRG